MLDEILKLELSYIYSLGLERIEKLSNKERLYYESKEDFAGIIGIILALTHGKSNYFYRYKEKEGESFREYLRASININKVLSVLKSVRGKRLYIIGEDEVITFRQRMKKVKDPSILDAKTRRAYRHAQHDSAAYIDYLAVNRRRGLSYVIEARYIRARGPYYGYRIVERQVAESLLKNAFEVRLERLYKALKDRRVPLTEEAKEIIKKVESITPYKELSFDFKLGEKLYERIDLRPPCMAIILAKLEETGYLKHALRFQLGTFLKFAGMDPETQMRFRYSKAVDNANISREDFVKKGGYQIKHIYGLTGSGKDYRVPSCRSAREGDYYCPFSDESIEDLEALLKKLGLDEKKAREISSLAAQRTRRGYSEACMKYFEAKIGKRLTRSIRSPDRYLYLAAIHKGVIKREKDDRSRKGSRRRVRRGLSNSRRGTFRSS